MELPIDLSLIPTEEFLDDVQKYVQDMVLKLALTDKIILENTRESQQRIKSFMIEKPQVQNIK